MRKHVIITVILLVVTAYVTVVYFKNLSPPGKNTARVMRLIPDSAPIVFEFSNDDSFYDIFKGNTLFEAVTGKQQFDLLDTLRQQVLQKPLLDRYFNGQDIFISFYPVSPAGPEYLYTLTATKGFGPAVMDQLAKQANSGLVITPLRIGGKLGYNVYISVLKKIFYLVNNEDNIYSASFSKDLITKSALYKPEKNRQSFVLLPDQQNANSLANIYINYGQLDPLFNRFFSNKNSDIFKSFRLLPGLAALSLNYKTDALMFNGSTSVLKDKPLSYLNLFAGQHPVENHLKDIFPSTTAYGTNFSVSDPAKFTKDLAGWYNKAGLKSQEDQLFSKIQRETGMNMQKSFNGLLGNEFAIITTRYFEKFALISIKNGSQMSTLLANVSKTINESSGQLSYDKVPFFLLGDAFSIFRHPYYLIIDNYLILANSPGELKSYSDTYLNQKFLSKNAQYQQFDQLLAAQSNVSFLVVFKNTGEIFRRDMDAGYYYSFVNNDPGWKGFYAASWQLTTADKDFYTNFCLRLHTDSVKN